MKIDLLKIKSSFPPPKGDKFGFDTYISSMERLIKHVVDGSKWHFFDQDFFGLF